MAALTGFGTAHGMAFPIVEDILDLVATDDQLGKPAGHDLIEGVYTRPALRAMGGPAGSTLRDLLGQPIEGERWEEARSLVRSSDGIEQATATAREYTGRAAECLSPLRDRPAAEALADAAAHLLLTIDESAG